MSHIIISKRLSKYCLLCFVFYLNGTQHSKYPKNWRFNVAPKRSVLFRKLQDLVAISLEMVLSVAQVTQV